MKIPSQAVPWIIAGVTLLFAGVLVAGLYQGELTLPSKGFRTHLRRASNPFGFYAVAAFYAALTGLCAWLLFAVLRARNESLPRSRPSAGRREVSRHPDFPGTVEIEQEGRGGHVVAKLASGTHSFWWEFGGGDCVAVISVPTAAKWPDVPALAPHARDAFLLGLARIVGARQCPNARIEITPDAILFKQ